MTCNTTKIHSSFFSIATATMSNMCRLEHKQPLSNGDGAAIQNTELKLLNHYYGKFRNGK